VLSNTSINNWHCTDFLAALKHTVGLYILNGNWTNSWPGDYEGAGTVFTYRKENGNLGESIFATGPLSESVDLIVITTYYNIIHYSHVYFIIDYYFNAVVDAICLVYSWCSGTRIPVSSTNTNCHWTPLRRTSRSRRRWSDIIPTCLHIIQVGAFL